MPRSIPQGECLCRCHLYHETTLSISRSFLTFRGNHVTILTVQDLATLSSIPTMPEISLQTIAQFYDQYLANKQFCYEVADKKKIIRIQFESGALCHLLGIHHIVRGQEGKGWSGHMNILEKRITFDSLKAANKGSFNEDILRMICFPYVYQMLHNPRFIRADANDIVKAEFILHDQYGKKYLQLKLRKQFPEHDHFYVPITFKVLSKEVPKKNIQIKNFRQISLNEEY